MITADITNKIIDYESGEMEPEEVYAFFQELIDTGLAWELQGSYGRFAMACINSGQCHRPEPDGNSLTDPTEHYPEDDHEIS